jgi:hypothetical protein
VNINISLTKAEVDRLVEVAKLDGRAPRDHAALLVRRGLGGPLAKVDSTNRALRTEVAERLIEVLEMRGLLDQLLDDQ